MSKIQIVLIRVRDTGNNYGVSSCHPDDYRQKTTGQGKRYYLFSAYIEV